MKNILPILLLSTFLPNLINAGCSFFEPIDFLDSSKGPRVWYAVRRYENGLESKTTCQILDITKLETPSKKLYLGNGTSLEITGDTPIDPNCSNGKVIVKNITPGYAPVLMVTYINYELNIMVVRACYNNEEYMWAYASKKRPCKKAKEAIDAVIKEQKLDTKTIYKMCKCDLRQQ